MQKTEPLIHGNYYHIYNCGINGEQLFRENANYKHFLNLYDKYIETVAETYAWCLMGNHFHFLVRIKELHLTGFENLSGVKKHKPPHQYFSNLFNAYTKAFNIRYSRHGSLFERPFKRKKIEDENYLKNLVIYIHNNPVHHGFCQHTEEYYWSSYHTCISNKPTRLKREIVINWFEDLQNFKFCHRSLIDLDDELKLE